VARRPAHNEVVLAAGGIVWRQGPNAPEVAVIHRPRHQDWTLPKGKLDAHERWQDAALREAREETGLRLQLEEFAGGCTYMTRHAPKVVLYWHMRASEPYTFAPHDAREVDALDWLTVEAALARLTHPRERRMLQDAAAPASHLEPDAAGSAAEAGGPRRGLLGFLYAKLAHRDR
jgi:8-oxo-dGTP diphosphatase